MTKCVACLTWLFLALIAAPLHGQALAQPTSLEPGSQLEISLLTFGPGEVLWERFGHNAIRIRDASARVDIDYNYGIFDFSEDDFTSNFARGRMMYRIAADDTQEDLALYAEEGRWVVEQRLNLTGAQRLALRDFLEWNRRPENALYRYEYFTANCSTRVRDALDKVLGGRIHDQLASPSKGFTFRMHADRLMRPDLLPMLGMDLGLGPFADKRLSSWDESFVPMELMQHLRGVSVPDSNGQPVPLVLSEKRINTPRLPEPPDFPSDLRWPFGIIGVLLGGLLLFLSSRREKPAARYAFVSLALLISLLCTLAGVVLAALWGFTEHVSAWRNENLLQFNPLCLLLIPTWWRARRAQWRITRFGRGVAYAVLVLAALALCVKILPWFVQSNTAWIFLMLPLHAALAKAIANRPKASP